MRERALAALSLLLCLHSRLLHKCGVYLSPLRGPPVASRLRTLAEDPSVGLLAEANVTDLERRKVKVSVTRRLGPCSPSH